MFIGEPWPTNRSGMRLDMAITSLQKNVVPAYFTILKACDQSFRRKPGMHQSMQSGSMARAASAFPMSETSQPNWSTMPEMIFFAPSSLPQMNMVGLPPANFGSLMQALPTELNALTKL